MKFSLLFGTVLLFVLSACSGGKSATSTPQQDVAALINAKDFAFRANQMYPSGGRTRILNETYLFSVTPSQVVSDLPYAGRAYTANPGSTDGGMRFTSKDFSYQQTTGKKDSWVITINPKDQNDVRECLLTVYANGNADLSISSNNRQTIRYSGYLQANLKK